MANPKNTIGDRDYGRRTYASNKSYGEQRRLATDAHIGRGRRVPHSEDKKPYLPDQSYPEMEMFKFDWDNPKWPGLPPGEPPTTGPVDPGGPVLPVDPNKPKPPGRFMGCEWVSSLGTLHAGQVKSVMLMRRDDPVIAVVVYGPADIIGGGRPGVSQSGNWSLCTAAGQGYANDLVGGHNANSSECVVIIRVKEDVKNFDHTSPYFTIGADSNGPFPVVVEGTTASGATCSAMGWVEACDDADPGPQYDYTRSGQSVAPGGTLNIYIKDPEGGVLYGIPPFYWSIAGTGFSFVAPKGDGRSNQVLAASGSCGSGTITIVDNCGKQTKGYVRSTVGQWNTVPYYCIPGAYGVSLEPTAWFTQGNVRIRQSWHVIGGCCCACVCGSCAQPSFGGGEPCESQCDNWHAWGCFVCLNSNVQMGQGFPSHCAYSDVVGCEDENHESVSCFGVNQLNVEEWECPP